MTQPIPLQSYFKRPDSATCSGGQYSCILPSSHFGLFGCSLYAPFWIVISTGLPNWSGLRSRRAHISCSRTALLDRNLDGVAKLVGGGRCVLIPEESRVKLLD